MEEVSDFIREMKAQRWSPATIGARTLEYLRSVNPRLLRAPEIQDEVAQALMATGLVEKLNINHFVLHADASDDGDLDIIDTITECLAAARVISGVEAKIAEKARLAQVAATKSSSWGSF